MPLTTKLQLSFRRSDHLQNILHKLYFQKWHNQIIFSFECNGCKKMKKRFMCKKRCGHLILRGYNENRKS